MLFRMPDITQAQVLAAVTWIISQAVATGLIDSTTGKMWLQIGSSVIAAGWIIADAVLRGSRARAVAVNPGAFQKTAGKR